MTNQASVERREVHYEGLVQGVGFRYTTRNIAGRYEVQGFVRNLADGRVQVVAEGAADQLDGFLADIAAEMSGNISQSRVVTLPATCQFTRFEVRL